MEFNIDEVMPSLIAIIIIGLAVFFFAFLGRSFKENKEKALQQYQECKAKTADLEWCFKVFKPELN